MTIDIEARHPTEKRVIVFFGDGSSETQTTLSRILRTTRKGSLADTFLVQARDALKEEKQLLPASQQKWLPSLDSLDDFLAPDAPTQPVTALHPPEIIVTQIASFISSYEKHPTEPYPNASTHIVTGLCFGELSASAVALASSLVELTSLGVDAVRAAFRAGIAAHAIAEDIESASVPAESWSVALSRSTGLAELGALESLCDNLQCTRRRSAYISAESRNTVTLGGPPSTIRKILAQLGNTSDLRSRVHIYGPYHANHLYSKDDAADILEQPLPIGDVYNRTQAYPTTRNLVSGYSGHFYNATSGKDLLEQVLYTILAQPILWDNFVDGCSAVLAEASHADYVVRNFAPSAAVDSLVRILAKTYTVRYDDSFMKAATEGSSPMREPIAIVGMSGRFPQAANVDEFWANLEKGLDSHKIIPSDRFDPNTHLKEAPFGCFLDRPGLFDPRFFNMSPREALETDPGQRLALVTAYEALESAGFVPNRTPSTRLGRIGTFFGQVADEYKEQNMAQDVGTYFIPGSMRAFGPGRINYFFKFGGPAYNVDTACSSSLVALNLACHAIWSADCDTAVAGGMNICCSSDNFRGLSTGHFLSKTGGCKTYDEFADGYCRGEAVGSVVVKRLTSALADNDNILGTILATGTNYNALAESITRPHVASQEELYRRLLRQANIEARDVDYIEAHGTGTQAGDAVETASIANVFAPLSGAGRRSANNPLLLGAVKANVGHGESASGVTALIKSLLVLQHGSLPPHVGIKTQLSTKLPNLDERRIVIPLTTTPLRALSEHQKRRIMVNNFSAAGGNTALVLEAPSKGPAKETDPRLMHVVSLTAKTASALRGNMSALLQYLQNHPNTSLSDLAYTTTARRVQYAVRYAVSVPSITALQSSLELALSSSHASNVGQLSTSKPKPVAFAFTGQGSFSISMAPKLFQYCKQFRSDLVRFEKLCIDFGFPAFLSSIDGTAGREVVFEPVQTQLALVALEMALVSLYASWGVRPDVVVGHSLGEYAALYAAGVLSAADALFLVGQRATLLKQTVTPHTHGMLAISMRPADFSLTFSQFEMLEYACINGPSEFVLSGPLEVLRSCEQAITSKGHRCTLLSVPYAFHSSQIDPILKQFEETCAHVRFSTPKIPVLSPLLGRSVTDDGVFSPLYLCRHAREAVNFEAAVEGGDVYTWVELGPHPVCLGMLKQVLDVTGLPTLQRNEDNWTTIAKSMASLHGQGYQLDWNAHHKDFEQNVRLLSLPTYSFDNKDYWIPYKNDWLLHKAGALPHTEVETGPATATVQRLVSKKANGSLVFESNLHREDLHSVIVGHVMNGCGLCPASVYADIALTVGDYLRREYQLKYSGIDVTSMEMMKPIIVALTRPAEAKLLRIHATTDLDAGTVALEYRLGDVLYATCSIQYGDSTAWMSQWARSAYLLQTRFRDLVASSQNGSTHKIFRKLAYRLFSSTVEYGEPYQAMKEVFLDSEGLEAATLLELPESRGPKFFFSPFWIDAFVHLAGFVVNANETLDPTSVYISHGWTSMRFGCEVDPSKPYRAHVKMQPLGDNILSGDMAIFQDDIRIGSVEGLEFQKIPRTLLDKILPPERDEKIVPLPGTSTPAPVAARKSAPKVSLEAQKQTQKFFEGTVATTQQFKSQVLTLIAGEVGVPTSELADHTLFSELGVDSLLALTLSAKLRELLHIDLPQNAFLDYPTVGALQNFISGLRGETGEPAEKLLTNGVSPTEAILDAQPHSSQSDASDNVSIVRTLVAEQMGVEVDEIVEAEDLATLGLDSLMSLSIFDAINNAIGIVVNRSDIGSVLSMAAIERALGLEEVPKPEVKPLNGRAEIKSANGNLNGATNGHTNGHTSKPPQHSFLLQGDPQTARHTVFLFPDGSGAAASYSKLPQISPQACIYGLNSPFLKTPDSYTSVEDVSRVLVEEMRRRQSHGPYIIAGWSAGGYYALEAVRQLLASGEAVRKLILIDSPCRLLYEAMPLQVLDYLTKHNVMGDGNTPPPAWLVAHFAASLTRITDYMPTALVKPRLPLPETYVIWAADGVAEDFDPAAHGLDESIRVTNFLLKKRPTNLGAHGWDQLLPGTRMWATMMPGNHFQIVMPPNGVMLSSLIADALEGDSKKMQTRWQQVAGT